MTPINQVDDLTNASLAALRELLGDENPKVRLSACRIALAQTAKLREHHAIEAELARLEKELKAVT